MLNPPPLPMAVCQLQSFSFYSSGVYYDKNCGNKPEDLDHAVLAVGYGTDVRNLPRGTSCLFTCLLTYCLSCCSPQPPPPLFFLPLLFCVQPTGGDYWIIKNSWSTHYGDNGYVLMSRKDNNCGVATDAHLPIV